MKNKMSTRKRNAIHSGNNGGSNMPNDNSDAGEYIIEDNQQYLKQMQGHHGHNKNVIM